MSNSIHYLLAITAEDILKYIGESSVIAFDYETKPLDLYRNEPKAALDPAKNEIAGISFSVAPGTGIYVPVSHQKGPNINHSDFMKFLNWFLTNPKLIKIAHNIAFESAVSYHLGIVIQEPVYDTMAASQMTLKNSTEYRTLQESGLKTLAREQLTAIRTFEEVTAGRSFADLDPIDPSTIAYAAGDSDNALQLYYLFNDWFDRFLPKHRWIIEHIESPTAVYLGLMKHNGVPLDVPLMLERKQEAEAQRQRLAQEIALIIGDVDIGANCATKAFKDYLYKDLKLPVFKATATNRAAADDATMIMLTEWCDTNRPDLSHLFELVQEYRKWGKIESTYIDGYLKYKNSVTERIHPDFFALSTETGRLNCQRPNAQNMPRKTNDPIGVRNFIKAPAGFLIISCDESQIELRVGAFYCRDQTMMDTYRNGGDIHAATTSVIFGVTYNEAKDKDAPNYKEHRTIAKNVNFGTFYGLFPRGLQKTLKFKAGVERSVNQCAAIIASLKDGYPGLTRWQEATKAQAARSGYIETWLGRRRYLPDISSEDWGKKSFAERCALNTPIQGTAADILKLAMARVLKGLPERPWLQPILQIHDELTFIIPEDRLEEAVAFIKSCMEQQPFPEFDLPLVAEASAGPTFGTMKELEE